MAGALGELGVVISELLTPLNIFLLSLCVFLIYKIFSSRRESALANFKPEPPLPPMKKRDMTLEEIRKYDGTGEDSRILIAVNNKVFDVTRGKHFYGPGGPYHAFAGRDASRGLATFSLDKLPDQYDDLSDLNTMEMDSVREWEMQFTEKYHYVGKLLRPGEDPTDYSDDDEPSEAPGDAPSTDAKPHDE